MLDASWEANVGCQVYRVELDRHRKASEDEQRVTKDLLANLLLMFGDTTQPHVRDLLLEICEEMDEMFPFPRRREDAVSEDMVHWEVKYNLDMAVWFGELTIRKLDDPWWERLPPPELTKPPPREPVRVIPPRREPVEPPEKTWFAAQFVDESGLWIDGLAVKMKINGVAQSLTTDKAGVVKVTEQTASISIVSVADIPQAERVLLDRLDKLDEAGAPTGKDVVDYPLEEPAKTVNLQPATPRTIILGLRRTWFEARVIDEVGVPVPGLDLAFSVNGDSTLTTDGAGVARLEALGNPSATVVIASVSQAQRILDPRWTQMREAKIPGGSDVSVLSLAEVMGAIPLIEKRRHTIVLTPERTWIEVRVVDDNNNPISGKRARLHLTDGRVVEKVLEDDGLVRGDEIPAGVCKFVLPVKDRKEWIDPDAPAPAEDPKELPKGHWIVRKHIEPPGPEVEGLETGESHVVVVGRKIVEQLEIDDALFRLMSAVLLPEAQNPGAAPTEPDGTRPTTLDLLAASLRYAQLHPKDRKILITGHTDTSGGDEYNENLSEFRAIAVHAVLTNGNGARQDFGDVCHGPHLQGKEKKQQVLYDDRVQVLNWVAATFGWPCSTNGEYWNYLQAVKAFQSTYNTKGNEEHPKEQLEIDGDFGPASWRAVFDCYQVHLAETLEITTEDLASLQGDVRGQFVKSGKPLVGCGEYKPKEMAGLDNYRSQTNRRVEVLFFEPKDHVPEVPCLVGDCEPGGCELYDRKWYLRTRLSAKVATATESLSVFVYKASTTVPIDDALVVLRGPSSSDDHTNNAGLVEFVDVVPGEYTLEVSHPDYSAVHSSVRVPNDESSANDQEPQELSSSEGAKHAQQQGKNSRPVRIPLRSSDWYPLRVVVKAYGVGLDRADVKLDGTTIGQTGSSGVFPSAAPQIHRIPIGSTDEFVVQVWANHYGPPPPTAQTPVRTWTWNAAGKKTKLRKASEIRDSSSTGDIVNVVNVELERESPLLTFRVHHHGAPLSGADVEVKRDGPQGAAVHTGTTDAAGEYRVRVVPGNYYPMVHRKGFLSVYGRPHWFETVMATLEGGDMILQVPLVPVGTPAVARPPRPTPLVAIWAHGTHVPLGVGGGTGYVDVLAPNNTLGDTTFDVGCVLYDLTNLVTLFRNTGETLPPGNKLDKNQIRRLALVSHGEPGRTDVDQLCSSTSFGGVPVDATTSLTTTTLPRYRSSLLAIGEYLCGDASVLIASCQTADGTVGEQLLIELSKLWPTVKVVGIRSRGSLNTNPRPGSGGLRYPGAHDTGHASGISGALAATRPWMSEGSPSATVARDGNIIRRGKPPTP